MPQYTKQSTHLQSSQSWFLGRVQVLPVKSCHLLTWFDMSVLAYNACYNENMGTCLSMLVRVPIRLQKWGFIIQASPSIIHLLKLWNVFRISSRHTFVLRTHLIARCTLMKVHFSGGTHYRGMSRPIESMITWLNSPYRSQQQVGTLQDHIKICQWHHYKPEVRSWGDPRWIPRTNHHTEALRGRGEVGLN